MSVGLADRMKGLDLSKIRFGGPPPDLFKKLSGRGTGDGGEGVPVHPFAHDERYRVPIRMRILRIPDGNVTLSSQ